jgi:hypothetical protein
MDKGGPMKCLLFVFAVISILTACTPKLEQISPYVDQTLTALPTRTSYPTNTAFPTYTPLPTYTKVPTYTPIIKIVTPTHTLAPTSTKTPTPTNTPEYSSYQLTATANKATNDYKALFEQVPWKDFITYPEKYEGKKIRVNCRVFNIVKSSNHIQCYVSGTYEAFYVKFTNSFDDIYENNILTIYGTGDGLECFTNTMGNQVCQPLIKDAFFTR